MEDVTISERLAALSSIVDETSADLSESRRRHAHLRGGGSGSGNERRSLFGTRAASASSSSTSSFPPSSSLSSSPADVFLAPHEFVADYASASALADLRHDVESRERRTRELVSIVESDVKTARQQHAAAADAAARLDAGMERIVRQLHVLEARQGEIWQAAQQRPTRSEVDTTISAAVLPSRAYAKTRIDALSETVSALLARVEALEANGGVGGTGAADSVGRIGGGSTGPSLEYLEQRLERRMEDFLERKMRLRARKMEADIVATLKDHAAVRAAWGEGGSDGQEGEAAGNGTSQENNASAADEAENAGDRGNNAATDVTTVTVKDLEALQDKFGKEVRLVQNSLVSLRTQLRMLSRDIKELKK